MKRLRARGYSLLEVLVAFALLAGALTVLLGALSTAARQVRQADDAGRARLHAQSLLAGLGIEQPLQPGSRSGDWDDGRYRWQLQVAPWQDPAAGAGPQQAALDGPALLHLQLEVRWGERAGQRLQLESLRLAYPPAGGGGG